LTVDIRDATSGFKTEVHFQSLGEFAFHLNATA
jgi:hypothetical protein